MKIPQGACAYGARLMISFVNSFCDQIEGGKEAKDIEYVHQLRVYSRRLRSALPIFIQCLPQKDAKHWQKQIKRITKSLGSARDLDVQITSLKKVKEDLPETKFQPGIQRLILRLSQRRELIQVRVTETLDQINHIQFLNDMKTYLLEISTPEEAGYQLPIQLYKMAFDSISKNIEALIKFDKFVYDPQYVKELHEMRIAAKGLRYTIEIFAPIYQSKLKIPYQTIRQAQEILGTIHDCDVWLELMPKFKDEEKQRITNFYGNSNAFNFILPGLDYFESNRYALRLGTYEQFRKAWIDWKSNRIWENLIDTIEMPSFPKDALISED